MANELAAMAKMPSGATMTVVMICAPQIRACSTPIGKPMAAAWRMVFRVGRKRPCVPVSFRADERVQRYVIMRMAVTTSASVVPKAAPTTPRPAPGIHSSVPKTAISREGKMRKKL